VADGAQHADAQGVPDAVISVQLEPWVAVNRVGLKIQT
jgi:hypothetical protein